MTTKGTEIHYEVKGGVLRPELLRPDRLGEHVWVAVAAYRVSPEALRVASAQGVHLDRENLASVEVGCYVCEQPWAARLAYRQCPGEPAPSDPQQPETD